MKSELRILSAESEVDRQLRELKERRQQGQLGPGR